jgi:hypothetical protein
MASQLPGTSPTSPSPPVILSRSQRPWFCAAIEHARGRPLVLAAAELSSPRLSLWVTTGDVDLILYPLGAGPTEQLHAIAHQAAHVLLGHQAVASDVAPSLFPHLAPDVVAATIMISRFSAADELAAESLASQLVTNAELPQISGKPGCSAYDSAILDST